MFLSFQLFQKDHYVLKISTVTTKCTVKSHDCSNTHYIQVKKMTGTPSKSQSRVLPYYGKLPKRKKSTRDLLKKMSRRTEQTNKQILYPITVRKDRETEESGGGAF